MRKRNKMLLIQTKFRNKKYIFHYGPSTLSRTDRIDDKITDSKMSTSKAQFLSQSCSQQLRKTEFHGRVVIRISLHSQCVQGGVKNSRIFITVVDKCYHIGQVIVYLISNHQLLGYGLFPLHSKIDSQDQFSILSDQIHFGLKQLGPEGIAAFQGENALFETAKFVNESVGNIIVYLNVLQFDLHFRAETDK